MLSLAAISRKTRRVDSGLFISPATPPASPRINALLNLQQSNTTSMALFTIFNGFLLAISTHQDESHTSFGPYGGAVTSCCVVRTFPLSIIAGFLPGHPSSISIA